MKTFLLVGMLLAVGCDNDNPTPPERTGPLPETPTSLVPMLRTYRDINGLIGQRLFVRDPLKPFSLFVVLADDANNPGDLSGLEAALGWYSTDVTGVVHLEATVPTPVSMFLWNEIMRRLSEQLSRVCDGAGQSLGFATLDPMVHSQLSHLCFWPGPEARASLTYFWRSLMQYRAPEEELDAWLEHFTAADSPYQTAAPTELIKDAFQSMLLNPYFLLAE